MGAASAALTAALVLAAAVPRARADTSGPSSARPEVQAHPPPAPARSARDLLTCTGTGTRGDHFAACFDPGNRLSLTAATDGFGGAVALRHEITFDDEPDLVWKMTHDILDATYSPFSQRLDGTLYSGLYLRHSRDGHILLPFGGTQRVFLPFDIGALFEIGRIEQQPGTATRLGVVETAALLDFSRTRDFRRRFAIGPAASWNVQLDKMAVTDHEVSPFSSLLADLHLESNEGRTIADLRGEVGMVWHSTRGWVLQERAEARLERIVISVNDHPVLLYAQARYESVTSEKLAGIGLRIVLVDRSDPRVNLDPLK